MPEVVIHKPTKSILVKGHDKLLLDNIPSAKALVVNGREITSVKHEEAETVWMLERGYELPFPAEVYFEFPLIKQKFQPFAHQIKTAGFVSAHRKCAVLNEIGTGKTESILSAFEYLMQIGKLKSAVIIAPLSTLECVWANAIRDTLPHRSCSVVYGTAKKRKELLAEPKDYYILNYAALTILEEELRKRTDLAYIFDEAQALRNGKTKMYSVVKTLVTPSTKIVLASGSIIPNGAEGAWAIGKLINPKNTPKFFGHWRMQVSQQISQFKWIPKPDAHKLAHALMQPAILYKKRECIDLPPNTIQRRSCELSPEQKTLFKAMRNEMLSELESGVNITAVSAADKLLKLIQIIAGSVKEPETDNYHDIPCEGRINAVLEIIEEAKKKILISCDFSGAIRMLTKALRKSGLSVAMIDGSVSVKNRNEIIDKFQNSDEYRVLVCNSATVSTGVTLTAADVVIHYAPIFSLDRWIQFNGRIDRPGQDTKTTTVLISGSSFEDKLYDRLLEKNETLMNTLELYKLAVA